MKLHLWWPGLNILFSSLLVFSLLSPLATVQAKDTSQICQPYNIPVKLSPVGNKTYKIFGKLCYKGTPEGKTLQILTHGLTLTGTYWDFPYQPEKYSYVDSLTKGGYATFSMDRIGVGNSERPPSTSLTVDAHAYVLHQLAQKFRAGEIGDTPFSKIIGVGHSLGSVISVVNAGKYQHDFDGLILTGLAHPFNVLKLGLLALNLTPSQLDPVLKDQNDPVGYLTLSKKGRHIFYNEENLDPKILNVDNQTKGTGVLTELATVDDALLPTLATKIKVPILVAVGEKDELLCSKTVISCASNSDLLKREKLFYPNASDLDTFVLPNAGHNLNYELNAIEFFNAAKDWSDQQIGTKK